MSGQVSTRDLSSANFHGLSTERLPCHNVACGMIPLTVPATPQIAQRAHQATYREDLRFLWPIASLRNSPAAAQLLRDSEIPIANSHEITHTPAQPFRDSITTLIIQVETNFASSPSLPARPVGGGRCSRPAIRLNYALRARRLTAAASRAGLPPPVERSAPA